MPNAYVLLTALPPTKGHLDLIKYARGLGNQTFVIVNTQPGEPFWSERVASVRQALLKFSDVGVYHIHKTLPQEPEGQEGFWDMWAGFLHMFGFQPGDYVVASEMYGKRLAEEVHGVFMPYDLYRSIRYTKATRVREMPRTHWEEMIPEFRQYLTKDITIFGAESTGKTTTARELGLALPNSTWLPEWARPYMEKVVTPEITVEKMHAIMRGQFAMEGALADSADFEFRIRDTDLYSTIGYWEFYSPETVPDEIYDLAAAHKSDLYVMLAANIPYEKDPLRYGEDHREIDDEFWIEILERFNLPHVIVDDTHDRIYTTEKVIRSTFPASYLNYQRQGKEYARV